ncbi:MAG: hypothetical protein ACKO9S_01670, partial [Bacteroidota bacterium]
MTFFKSRKGSAAAFTSFCTSASAGYDDGSTSSNWYAMSFSSPTTEAPTTDGFSVGAASSSILPTVGGTTDYLADAP